MMLATEWMVTKFVTVNGVSTYKSVKAGCREEAINKAHALWSELHGMAANEDKLHCRVIGHDRSFKERLDIKVDSCGRCHIS